MGVHADYCAILGVAHDANIAEIKRGYRQAALRWHPDKNPHDRENAELRFKEIATAYERMSLTKSGANLQREPSRTAPFDVASANELFESVFAQHPGTADACEAAEVLLAEMQSLEFAEAMFRFCQEQIKKIEQGKVAEMAKPGKE